MPEWKREIREALAGAKLETDAACEEAVVEELEQDLTERYEELVKDLAGTMRRVYDGLGLGGFDAVRPKLEAYAEWHAGYETNKYPLTPELRARVKEWWGDIIEKLGY